MVPVGAAACFRAGPGGAFSEKHPEGPARGAPALVPPPSRLWSKPGSSCSPPGQYFNNMRERKCIPGCASACSVNESTSTQVAAAVQLLGDGVCPAPSSQSRLNRPKCCSNAGGSWAEEPQVSRRRSPDLAAALRWVLPRCAVRWGCG